MRRAHPIGAASPGLATLRNKREDVRERPFCEVPATVTPLSDRGWRVIYLRERLAGKARPSQAGTRHGRSKDQCLSAAPPHTQKIIMCGSKILI